MQQPPADFLISIMPGVRKLVEAAVTLGPNRRISGDIKRSNRLSGGSATCKVGNSEIAG
jgi:hypothetical protein